MTAGEIKRLSIPLQTTHHPAAFESAGNQRGQFRGIDIGTDLASSLPILGNRLHTVKPRTESLASFRSQLWIAVVTIDGRVQQREASWNQPGTPVSKVPHDLLEAVNRISICSVPSKEKDLIVIMSRSLQLRKTSGRFTAVAST